MRTCLLVLALTAITAFAQPSSVPVEPLDGPTLEALHQASLDDAGITIRLLRFYGTAANDPGWTKRFAVISWNIQNHPSAPFLSSVETDMPPAFQDQVKQLWITQVHQHPDNPQVLRNAAAAMNTAPQPIRVGGNVQNANLISKVDPPYPPLARESRIQGMVRLNTVIGIDGHVHNLQLVSGHPLLAAAAMQAAEQWVYKPTLLNGYPVQVITTIDINFTLQP